MNNTILFILLMLFCLSGSSQVDFETYFTSQSMRYDFELVGDYESEKVIYIQTKVEPRWGGNPNYLVEDLDYGTYRYSINSVDDGQLIFRKGFCPLFWEYQTTAEAKYKDRSFYQAAHFPRPKVDVTITIETRNDDNTWDELFADSIKADDYFVLNESPKSYKHNYIQQNGEPEQKIDLVIVSEGYTKKEMRKFKKDAQRLTDSLFMAEPFKTYRDRFNVVIVQVPSDESGTDSPGKNIYRNTAFNSTFYTFNSARYLTTSDMKSVYDAVAGVPWDHIYVVVNSKTYGGGGFYNFLSVCTSDNERSPFVFCHEFGHAFAGLGDEYYNSTTAYEQFYAFTTEPWEPNITTLVDFDSKWKNQLDKDTPIPTKRKPENDGIVGVFEGGGYVAKGIYSPATNCWMNAQSAGAFCPVCQKAIERTILLMTK